MPRRKKKKKKKRGSRTMGGGAHKRRRGAGSRGGRGMAGSHKHKWSWVIKHKPEYFGKRGFTRPPKLVHEPETINVGEIQEKIQDFLEQGIAQEKGKKITVDLMKTGCEKVLGKGRITQPLLIKAKKFSKSAAKKIEEAGGEPVETGEEFGETNR